MRNAWSCKASVLALAAASAAVLLSVGCLNDPQDDEGSLDTKRETLRIKSVVNADGTVSQAMTEQVGSALAGQATASFLDSCDGAFDIHWEGIPITHADIQRCRRKNGSTNKNVRDWNGNCFTDVSNCDGNLVCQSHCP
jgi:hypothetical protein